jgi:alcohol dehydrogenase
MRKRQKSQSNAVPNYYEFFNPVKIVSGKKALNNLPFELDQLGAQKPLIITDKGVTKAGLVKHVKQAFRGSKMTIGAIYDDVPADSSNEVVNDIARVYRENGCDSLVAVGGGSPIDTAKGVNIVITEESEDLMQFMGAELLKKPMKPLIVVPTTSGTGSEVTLVAVISNTEKNVKMAFTSYHLMPSAAILDPRMVLTMPPKITAATGMDALTHATEAYICLQKNPMSDAYSFAAISLIRDNLLQAVTDGKDEQARLSMANAATMAGAAFSNSMVGMVHSLGHATGGVAHIPHGIAMSIFLPFGLEYNMNRVSHYIGELLLPLGGSDEYAGTAIGVRPQRSVEIIRQLQQKLKDAAGLPTTLSEAGVQQDQLEQIAQNAINDGSLTYNPEEVDYNDALRILREAY